MAEEKSFDQIRYQNDYKRKMYDRIEFLIPKGEKALIKEKAAELNKSMNDFIYTAVKEKLEKM